ncbi:phosphate signaling complex protein PhoU [Paenibacillus solisilvae]|uniref:Phosphate-specific transport system accessory protein PhoU n=1 Tax=Paenibacillus solisilvae TaxID=2486751 RepID=A0ABW0VV40_9BACL
MEHRSSLKKLLTDLHGKLDLMGERVQEAVIQSVQSLQNHDLTLAKILIENDEQVNRMENQILELVGVTIATQQPVTKDMRKILTAVRMANDLERMADLAIDVAKVTLRLDSEVAPELFEGIPEMSEITLKMIHGSMTSYDRGDIVLAKQMAELDHEVDRLYGQFLKRNYEYMVKQPNTITQGLQLCFVGRFLERIADHATNIGENVIYMVSNERHDLNH